MSQPNAERIYKNYKSGRKFKKKITKTQEYNAEVK